MPKAQHQSPGSNDGMERGSQNLIGNVYHHWYYQKTWYKTQHTLESYQCKLKKKKRKKKKKEEVKPEKIKNTKRRFLYLLQA
jgi:hypothetical protein